MPQKRTHHGASLHPGNAPTRLGKRVRTATILYSLLSIIFLSSCRHRDFCYHHPDHSPDLRTILRADYRLEWEIPHDAEPFADWRNSWPEYMPVSYAEHLPTEPEGLRVVAFPPEGEGNPFLTNLPPHGGELRFNVGGSHSMLMFNNDTEYIQFDGLGSFATSRATTRARNRASYYGNRYYRPAPGRSSDEVTLAPPDMLFGQYVLSHHARSLTLPQAEQPDEVLQVEMHPLVFTYVVYHRVDSGASNIASARGALAGVARGVWLNSGTTTDEAATLLYDCEVFPSDSCVIARVRSFGVPGYPKSDYSRGAGSFALNVDLCLANGKVVRYEWDVTPQVAAQPRGGVITVGGISIRDEDARTYGSGFEVDVTDWGDDEDLQF